MALMSDHRSGKQVTSARVALPLRPMRFLLALLAVIGLLVSPATAAAAQAACHGHGEAAMSMAMPDMTGMDHADGKPDPCCDPAKDQAKSKHDAMSCIAACIAMCGIPAALPNTPAAISMKPEHGAPAPARTASLKPHEPDGLERPPRSIA